MEYADFVVRVRSEGGRLIVRVLNSPAGEGEAVLDLPQALARGLPAVPTSGLPLEASAARELGGMLFRSLFTGSVHSLFLRSLGAIEGRQDRGLLIKIVLDPFDPETIRHLHLPWELLYQEETGDFLSLSRRTPVVHSLRAPPPLPVGPEPGPLRVLVVAPKVPGLDLTAEVTAEDRARNVLETLQRSRVEVQWLAQASPTGLREALLTGSFHVLQYLGGAGREAETGSGILLFESPDGGASPVSGRHLAQLLKGSAPRLVLLSPANVPSAGGEPGVDPLVDIAMALLLGGMPAVVAMRQPLSEPAAAAFEVAFFRRLAAGDTVESALAEGRQAIFTRDPESAEWASPMLLTRGQGGRIVEADVPRNRLSPLSSPPSLRGRWWGGRARWVGRAPEVPPPRLKLFLCHASDDKTEVRKLYARLKKDGFEAWLDEEDLLPGQAWDLEIRRALKASHAVIACLSRRATTKAGYVQKEIAFALDRLAEEPEGAIFLIPAKLEECESPERLAHLHFVRLYEPGGYEKLTAALAKRATDLKLSTADG